MIDSCADLNNYIYTIKTRREGHTNLAIVKCIRYRLNAELDLDERLNFATISNIWPERVCLLLLVPIFSSSHFDQRESVCFVCIVFISSLFMVHAAWERNHIPLTYKKNSALWLICLLSGSALLVDVSILLFGTSLFLLLFSHPKINKLHLPLCVQTNFALCFVCSKFHLLFCCVNLSTFKSLYPVFNLFCFFFWDFIRSKRRPWTNCSRFVWRDNLVVCFVSVVSFAVPWLLSECMFWLQFNSDDDNNHQNAHILIHSCILLICSTLISIVRLTFSLSGRHDTAFSSSEHFCVNHK